MQRVSRQSRFPGTALKDYATRLDRFRAQKRIDVKQWAKEAGIARTQLNKYRAGALDPRADTVTCLVKSASRILNRSVRASELFDLGESEPVAPCGPTYQTHPSRKSYNTRFDRLLRRLGVPPLKLASESGIARQVIRNRRMKDVLKVSVIREIVSALRRMGHDVQASDLVDLGEAR